MKVYFDEIDLQEFNYKELCKMLEIQIHTEKYEGAGIIRDIINSKKKICGDYSDNNNNLELQ